MFIVVNGFCRSFMACKGLLMVKLKSYEEALELSSKHMTLSPIRVGLGKIVRVPMLLAYLSSCLSFSLSNRIRFYNLFSNLDPDFIKYFEKGWGHKRIGANFQKVQKGIFFDRYASIIKGKSMEIGFFDGKVSRLHLPQTTFDFGSEYYSPVINTAKKLKRWKKITNDTVYDLKSYPKKSVDSIVMIHTFDHFEDPDKAFSEISRIHRRGGRILFSGFSDYIPKAWFRRFLWLILGVSDSKKNSLIKKINRNMHFYSFYSKENMKKFLGKHGYELERYEYHNGDGIYMYVWNFLEFDLGRNGALNYSFLDKPFFKNLFKWFFISIAYPNYVKCKSNGLPSGIDFFVIAKRK